MERTPERTARGHGDWTQGTGDWGSTLSPERALFSEHPHPTAEPTDSHPVEIGAGLAPWERSNQERLRAVEGQRQTIVTLPVRQTFSREHVRGLQNGAGNRAVQRLLQRSSPPGALVQDPALIHQAAAWGTQTPASPLPFLDRLQPLFGDHDLSGVQAHIGAEATLAASAMSADAYASEEHVVFGGQPDLWTTAHEAAHVVQQQGGVQLSGGVGAAGDVYEQHADAVADKVVAGESVEGLLGQFSGGGDAGGASDGASGGASTAGTVQRHIKVGAAAAYTALAAFKAAAALQAAHAAQPGIAAAAAASTLDQMVADAFVYPFPDWRATFAYLQANMGSPYASVQFNVTPQAVALAGVAAFAPHGTTLIVQNPQERGDMHDLKIALALDANLRVVFALDDYRRRPEARDILNYYDNHAQVRYCIASTQDVKAQVPAARVRGVSQATETIVRAASNNRAATEQAILEQTTGLPAAYPAAPAPLVGMGPHPYNAARHIHQVRDAYDADLVNAGRGNFPNAPDATRYILINYRNSGHDVTAPRAPSHPELDTGVHGYADLVAAVTAAGFTPVPMGEPPGHAGLHGAPNLIQYWTWPSTAAHARLQTKRQSEYGLLRRLNELYNVKALAMRSGSTDALVFAGIETISLDFAAETFTQAQLAGTGLEPTSGSAASWRRAAKRDLIRPGKFHQGFLTAARADAVAPAPGAAWNGAINTAMHPAPAHGVPAPSANAVQVAALINQFFGSAAAPVPGRKFDLDPASPLTNIVASADRIRTAHRSARRAWWQAQFGGYSFGASRGWARDQANRINGECADVLGRLRAAHHNPVAGAVAEATALRDAVALQLPRVHAGAGPAPAPAAGAAPGIVIAVHARALAYLANVNQVTAYVDGINTELGNRIATINAVVNNATYDERFAERLATFEAMKEGLEFVEYAIKQLRNRIDVDDGIRQGNVVL